jgi:ATP-dependent helicase YprA (DUF1998 family)
MAIITLLAAFMSPHLAPVQGLRVATLRISACASSSTFGPLDVPVHLSHRLKACGFHEPMPIQQQALPLIAEGENVVIHSATGSGKTLAFLVPLIARLNPEGGLQFVIVAPSQELAVQLATEAAQLLRDDGHEGGREQLSSVILAISSSRELELEQQDALFASARPPSIMIGTPQRLADLCRHPRARPVLRSVQAVVLDEVDLMLPPLAAPPPKTGHGRSRQGRGAAPAVSGRGPGRGRGGKGGGRGGGRGVSPMVADSIERRIARKRPVELLIQRLERIRPRAAPPLQLVCSSATIDSDLRRQVGVMLGGEGKKAAGIVVTTEPAHPPPKSLKRFGIGGVRLPSTIRHSAYLGRASALNQVLKLAFEEVTPAAPLLVLPNGASVAKRVQSLRAIGFEGAVALQDALGVPSAPSPPAARSGGSDDGDGGDKGSASKRVRAAAGDSLQGEMVRQRAKLVEAFKAGSSRVPLLVTTEHSVRGMDLKGVDAVFMLGLPKRVDSYVHVAGRTAREGRKGRAVCLLTEEEEGERLDAFGRELGISFERIDVRFLR